MVASIGCEQEEILMFFPIICSSIEEKSQPTAHSVKRVCGHTLANWKADVLAASQLS
jgi:hypothetical protein